MKSHRTVDINNCSLFTLDVSAEGIHNKCVCKDMEVNKVCFVIISAFVSQSINDQDPGSRYVVAKLNCRAVLAQLVVRRRRSSEAMGARKFDPGHCRLCRYCGDWFHQNHNKGYMVVRA